MSTQPTDGGGTDPDDLTCKNRTYQRGGGMVTVGPPGGAGSAPYDKHRSITIKKDVMVDLEEWR